MTAKHRKLAALERAIKICAPGTNHLECLEMIVFGVDRIDFNYAIHSFANTPDAVWVVAVTWLDMRHVHRYEELYRIPVPTRPFDVVQALRAIESDRNVRLVMES